jgi:hypothetical protein
LPIFKHFDTHRKNSVFHSFSDPQNPFNSHRSIEIHRNLQFKSIKINSNQFKSTKINQKQKKIQKKTYYHRKFKQNSKNKKNIHIQNSTASYWCILCIPIEFTKSDTKHRIPHNSTGIHTIPHQNTYKYTQYTQYTQGFPQEYTQLTHMDTEYPHIDTPPNTYVYTHPPFCTPRN